ncbi:MAG TPA: hypothetical protein VFQ52_08455 [Rhizomicrobium sp.]|nr:hypothetical protein [Rhizomicrobium sp.]
MEAGPYTLWRERADADAPFVVCAMFTPGYRLKAERLAASLEQLGLAYTLFETPQIHRSVSGRGSNDIAFAKPCFISEMLKRFGKPMLYVDADMVFRQQPALIARLCADRTDFAIYNWLVDAENDAWMPAGDTGLWKFYFAMDALSDSQLAASGAVQLWNNTRSAHALLAAWEAALSGFPGVQDDHCLDFAFNHTGVGLCARWLSKEYARYAFWPYADPVIDHPDFPAPQAGQFAALGMKRVDASKVTMPTRKQHPFPRDALIDTVKNLLLIPQPDGSRAAVPLARPLFLPRP